MSSLPCIVCIQYWKTGRGEIIEVDSLQFEESDVVSKWFPNVVFFMDNRVEDELHILPFSVKHIICSSDIKLPKYYRHSSNIWIRNGSSDTMSSCNGPLCCYECSSTSSRHGSCVVSKVEDSNPRIFTSLTHF